MSAKLNAVPSPKRQLEQCEAVIANGLLTFIDVGLALRRIRDDSLYKERGYKTFEEYCRTRWDLSRTFAYCQIQAASIAENVGHGRQIQAPANERIARTLRIVPEEKQPDVWLEIVSSAPDGKVTAKHAASIARLYAVGTPATQFHILTAVESLQNAVTNVIRRHVAAWPEESRFAAWDAVRGAVDLLEKELSC